jgi:hypothetical protein
MTEKSQFSQVLGIVVTVAKAFLFRKWVVFIILGAALLAGALAYSVSRTNKWKDNSERLTENFQNIEKENKVLTFTASEWRKISGDYKNRADSAIKASKLKQRQVQEIIMVESGYLDTNRVMAKMSVPVVRKKDSIPLLKPVMNIPVSYGDSCWGFEGEVVTNDPETKVYILKRTFHNSFELIVAKPKYFLFIRIKKAEYKFKTDCGSGEFTSIKFE